MEEWKSIEGYEGLYEISNYGRIKSLKKIINHKKTGKALYNEKILKQTINYGYNNVILCKNNKIKYFKVHRLVAQAFIPNPDNLPFINHKDENRKNNVWTNLEWCTYIYNNNYGNRNKKISKALSKKVNQYDLSGNFIKTWDSISQVEKELNIHNSNIIKVCQGKRNKTGGYIWKYA